MEKQQYAGFWIRFGASFIDLIISVLVLMIPLFYIYGAGYWTSERWVYGFWDLLLGYIVPFVATLWFWHRFLATPGKMATHLIVVDARTGNKLKPLQSVIRYFAYILSAIPLGLGFLLICVDKQKQGLHDKLAGSVVIKKNQKVAMQVEGDKTLS